jgi:protein SCO1/2
MSRRARLLAWCWIFSSTCAAATVAADDTVARVGFDQRLHAVIPGGLHFRDESGADVRIAEYLNRSPLLLVFTYYGCSSLCPTVVGHLVETLDQAETTPAHPYQVIAVSIDPGDSPAIAAQKKSVYLSSRPHGRSGENWHLLTGSPANIAALANAAGFRYAYDVATHQYEHPAGFVVLTPQGTIARYFFGFDYTPRELAAALDGAAARRIASPVQRLLLLCFHIDSTTGKYDAAVLQALRWMAMAGIVSLVALYAAARRRERGNAARTK